MRKGRETTKRIAACCASAAMALWSLPARADIDVSGTFRVYQTHLILPPSEEIWVLSQTGTALSLEVSGVTTAGTIDPLTGSFTLDFGTWTDPCQNVEMLAEGQADADGNAFAYRIFEGVLPLCKPGVLYGYGVATRCLNGPLAPGEECITADEPLVGTSLSLRDKLSDSNQRKLALKIIDPSFLAPEPGSVEDPTAPGYAAGGLTLELARGTAETATLSMDSSLWRGLGTPAGSKGWLYRDPQGASGPCRSALVKDGLIKAVCKGSAIPFTLDEAAQNELGVNMQFGRVFKSRCSVFGGVVRETSTAAAPVGTFKAKDAPAPAVCPVP